jgi:hypothetical protein
MKHYILAIAILFFVTSCKKDDDSLFVENKINLISDLINSQYALPPPPPLSNDTITNWKITQKTIDSIRAIKLNIAIYPLLRKPTFNKDIDLLEVDKEFKVLIKNFSDIKATREIPIQDIDNKSRHKVVLADTIILKKSKDWIEYDLLLNISNLSFNKSFDKAALDIGISRSALWGAGGLYLFEKRNNKWIKVKYIEIEIW